MVTFAAYLSNKFDVNILALDHSQMASWSWNYFKAASRYQMLSVSCQLNYKLMTFLLCFALDVVAY